MSARSSPWGAVAARSSRVRSGVVTGTLRCVVPSAAARCTWSRVVRGDVRRWRRGAGHRRRAAARSGPPRCDGSGAPPGRGRGPRRARGRRGAAAAGSGSRRTGGSGGGHAAEVALDRLRRHSRSQERVSLDEVQDGARPHDRVERHPAPRLGVRHGSRSPARAECHRTPRPILAPARNAQSRHRPHRAQRTLLPLDRATRTSGARAPPAPAHAIPDEPPARAAGRVASDTPAPAGAAPG